MTLEAGARLGHYRIVGLLGRGGMADVYRAEDERLGREVALKAVPPEFARDPERVERFEHEVRAAAKLTHPNIVTVYEFGQGAGQHFYTMALMPGGDLKARIRAHPDGMPAAEARAVAAAMARALDYAHKRGLVHRDVKPENILFGEDGAPQLTDFGIARAMSSGTRMTAAGMSIGSPHYMSPEQARGQTVDGRSDLYSLGVVLYEMLTGRVPFDAGDTLAVAYAHVNDPVPELPPALAAWQPVVDRLLAKSPKERFGSAGDLAEELASDGVPRAPATRAMPMRHEVQPTTTPIEQTTQVLSSPRDAGLPTLWKELSMRLADATTSHPVTLAALACGALVTLAAVGVSYVALQDTDGPARRSPTGGGSPTDVQTTEVQPSPGPPTLPANPTNPFDVEDRERERPASDLDAELRKLEEARRQAEEARRQAEAVLRQAEEVRRQAEEAALAEEARREAEAVLRQAEEARRQAEEAALAVRSAPRAPQPPPPEPLRVGGNVSTPTKILDVPPVYPPTAQAARVQGIVILEAVIGPSGRVTDVKVLRSVPLLDDAAITAVRQWEYTPTLVNGVPVPVIMTVTINFTLQSRSAACPQ